MITCIHGNLLGACETCKKMREAIAKREAAKKQ